jgi:hypothetical protein
MSSSPHEVGSKLEPAPTSEPTRTSDRSSGSSHGWLNAIKTAFLAKAPLQGAPLEYGGHRVAEEPNPKGGVVGVLTKFARFFGPGMILTVAYIDPDNFQSSFSDGQAYGYLMICMVWFSLVVAIYLQVSLFTPRLKSNLTSCSQVSLLAYGYSHWSQLGPDEPQVHASVVGIDHICRG